MSSAAISTLGKIMVDPNAPASTRVRAADSILNHTTKALEIEDIEARGFGVGKGRYRKGNSFRYVLITASNRALENSIPECGIERAMVAARPSIIGIDCGRRTRSE